MFDEINNQNPNQNETSTPKTDLRANFNQNIPKPVEDILAEVDSTAKPAVFQPKTTSAQSVDYGAENSTLGTNGFKKFFIPGVVIIGMVFIFAIGYWGINFYLNLQTVDKNVNTNAIQQPSPAENNNKEINKEEKIVEEEKIEEKEIVDINEEQNNKASTSTPAEEAISQLVDSDQDGLTDEEEKILGSDPNLIDSDNDGLFDREEVKVYNTDLLSADTDADG